MLRLLCIILAFIALPLTARAQAWPERPVTIIVPFAAGGGTDILARVLAERLSAAFGQRFIVENKAGAGGMVGAGHVAKATPDGYTLLVSSPAEIAINQHIFERMTYDPLKELAPITLLAWTPLIIAAHPDLKIATPAELLKAMQERPQPIPYSTPGVGSGMHLAGEFLNRTVGKGLQHIPYRGAGPAVADAIAGQVPLTIAGMPPVVPHVKAGTLKAVAVTSARRSALFPDIPTLAEQGPAYRDIDLTNWFGFLAPAGVPESILRRLHAAAIAALAEPVVRQRIADQGAEPVGNTPAEFQAFIAAESEKYRRIAVATGVKAQP
jgi:tripartite-type tricarboxylate transporter receptor subunit TctC